MEIGTIQDRIRDYADALKIVSDRRYEFSRHKLDVPVIWDKLFRVGRYIEKCQAEMVNDVLGDPEKEVAHAA